MDEHAQHKLLAGLAAVIVMGVGGQWVASRAKVPAILLLLMAGAVVGPWSQVWVGHKLLDPDALLGTRLAPIVSLSVALILFEGGLTLKVADLVHVGRVVRNLVTVGAAITFAVTAAAAVLFLHFDWRLAVLLAAVLVVTGPTVIGPLLRHARPVGPVSPILKWEGIVIDPVGAILAVLVLDAVVAGHGRLAVATTVVLTVAKTAAVGLGVGIAAAAVLVVLLWRFWVADHLQNPFTLALVLGAFVSAELLQADSGLLAVTVMGIAAANQRLTSVEHIREFKESLSVLLVSSLFILLSARIDAAQIRQLGVGTVLFVGVLIVVGRPLAVWASTLGSNLSWREKAFVAAMAPRGIVAAAVSSVFALRLRAAGVDGAERLVPVTFAVIVITVTIYGLAAVPVGRALGVAKGRGGGGFLVVGANPLARSVGEALRAGGQQVLMVDTNPRHLAAARMGGFDTLHDSAVGDRVVERVEGTGIGTLLALTPNEEVNTLAAVHFARVFGRSCVFQLAQAGATAPPPAGDDKPARRWQRHRRRWRTSRELPGRVLFEAGLDYQQLSDRLAGGRVSRLKLTEAFGMAEFRSQFGTAAVPLFAVDADGQFVPFTADHPPTPTAGQTVVSVVSGTPTPVDVPHTPVPAPVGAV